MPNDLNNFEKEIGYTFKNKNLLKMALTHSSYANEKNIDKNECNERIEFLGDAVLELIVSEHIYKTHETMPEGEMTKLRASIVCEPSLSAHGKELNFGKYLLLGKGEVSTGGRTRDSIIADAFESVLGAVFLDGGLESAREYALSILDDDVKQKNGSLKLDYKTELQEIVQKNSKENIEYVIISEKGPDHDKQFISSAVYMNKTIGTGEGKTKKEAEQQAAKMAISSITK